MVRRGVAARQPTADRPGLAASHFSRTASKVRELPQFDYRFSSPSLFMQDEIAFTDKWTFAVSARADPHSEYGLLATPRISVLARPSAGWTVRVAAGTGTFAPTPFTEETEETGLSRRTAPQRSARRACTRRVARRHSRLRLGRGDGDRVWIGRSGSCGDEVSRRWVRGVSQRARDHANRGNRAAGAIPP